MSPQDMAISREHGFAVRLMEHLVVPTFVLSPTGTVIIWNKACERLTGLKADEVIGTKNHWKAFYRHERKCLADFFVDGQTKELDELYSSHSIQRDIYDGLRAENWCSMPCVEKRLYLAINAGPIFDDQGKLIAIVETLRDMTDQKRAEEALQSLAHKDGLTGLANRRSFDIRLEAEIQHGTRSKKPFALLLCDVDYFKPYNDTYGHQQGDECLKTVASLLNAQAGRPTDLVARYGGEEFAVILSDIEPDGVAVVAENIRKAIYDANMAHGASPSYERVTISVGWVCAVPEDGESAEEWIEKADSALYQAKHSGRNQVCRARA